MFALLLHIYYRDSWDTYLKNSLSEIKDTGFELYVNISISSIDNQELIKKIKIEHPSSIIIETPNTGKDIGGKLALLNHFFLLKSNLKYIVFLHDKKSPHSASGEQWRKTLYKIIDKKNIQKIIRLMKNQKIGIIGAKEFIINERNPYTKLFKSNNKKNLESLLTKYPLVLTNYQFIGGTMFWIKLEAIKPFFSKYSPIECRSELEHGNVSDNLSGTKTHAWERLLCWISSASNYILKGI